MTDAPSDHRDGGAADDLAQRLAEINPAAVRRQTVSPAPSAEDAVPVPSPPSSPSTTARDRAFAVADRLIASARGDVVEELDGPLADINLPEDVDRLGSALEPGIFVVFADGSLQRVHSGPPVEIGRGDDVRRLDVWGLSRRHLRLEFGDDAVSAVDLGSTNGTCLVRNGIESDLVWGEACTLEVGDVLSVAGTVILGIEERS